MSRDVEMVSIEELRARYETRVQPAGAAAPRTLVTERRTDAGPKEGWGVGDQKDAKAFDRGRLSDGTEYELFFGQYPHSRRDNDIYARFENGDVHGFDGHRGLVRIEIEMSNYLKESGISGSEIRKGGVAKLFVDDALVHTFFARDPVYAMQQMTPLLTRLQEHPADVWSPQGRERLIGRKVYYDNVPGVVRSWLPDQGAVVIEADEGHSFPKPAWWGDDEGDDWEWKDRIKTDLLSDKIWWFRREPTR